MLKSRLKVILAENDMTQKKLSELTGVRPGTITNIVNNNIKQIPVEAVCEICKVLKCDIGDIFHYEPEKQNNRLKHCSMCDIINAIEYHYCFFLFSFRGVTYAEGSSFLNVFSEESLTG